MEGEAAADLAVAGDDPAAVSVEVADGRAAEADLPLRHVREAAVSAALAAADHDLAAVAPAAAPVLAAAEPDPAAVRVEEFQAADLAAAELPAAQVLAAVGLVLAPAERARALAAVGLVLAPAELAPEALALVEGVRAPDSAASAQGAWESAEARELATARPLLARVLWAIRETPSAETAATSGTKIPAWRADGAARRFGQPRGARSQVMDGMPHSRFTTTMAPPWFMKAIPSM